MKKILLPGVTAGIVLLVLSYAVLYISIALFPFLVEEYYKPVFREGNERQVLYFLHPFVLSFALAWFWDRFKEQFTGTPILRGLQMGILYALVATLPSMWVTFSAIDVSLLMVLSWFAYGLLQAVIAGLIFSQMNP